MADELNVRPMRGSDAHGVSACVTRCYGDSYPKPIMYRPDELAARVTSGTYQGVVATLGSDVVGHIGFTWPTPVSLVVEAGTTVVDPRCRGIGVMSQLSVGLGRELRAQGVAGFVHFPTTAHEVMQRASVRAGGRETGIMLAYLPATARDLEIGGEGDERLAVTVVYQPIGAAPSQPVALPRRYRTRILALAHDLGLERQPIPLQGPTPARTVLTHTIDDARGLARISVERIGADVAEQVHAIASVSAVALVHVDLPMHDAALEHAVDQLRASSFVFAAWLPGWAGHDVLRLQRVARSTAAELDPKLVSAEANSLMTMIRAEIASTL
jgi:hypothetical protein